MTPEKEKKLSREYTEEEVAKELAGIDESLAEAVTTQRRRLPGQRAGGGEHRTGTDAELAEVRREERPKQSLPPLEVKAPKPKER